MDILIVPIPLFSKNMEVMAYYFRYQKGNDLMLEAKAAAVFDGAMNSPALETLKLVGIEPFAMDKPVFVPISSMMLLGSLSEQCPEPHEKVIFLLNGDVKPTEQYLSKIRGLKKRGYRFAMYKINKPVNFAPVLAECEYLFVNQKSPAAIIDPSSLPPNLWHIKLIATHVDTEMEFKLLSLKDFAMYEGDFYRLPITVGHTNVVPLKANLVRLLNAVQDEEFDFDEISSIITRDPSLSISLMRMVNSPYIGLSEKIKTIPHAVAMLGEREVRKWATTSVSHLLGSDKPDEISRLSLIRAKFAENLSLLMKMQSDKQSLLLTGLFSVLDIVLDMPMKDALAMVHVDDTIQDALINHAGRFYPVLQFIISYEQSDWNAVSRILILHDIEVPQVYDAYINATLWYKSLLEPSGNTGDDNESVKSAGK